MEKLEEEIASALTNRSMGTDGLLKLLMELERRVETGGLSEDIVVVKKLLSALDDFMGRARPVFRPAQPCSLNPALDKCLICLIHIVMSNSEAHDYVREETCVMERLTSLLNDDYELPDKRQMLKAVEVLSRRLKIVWSAPYLTSLIKNLFKMLVVQRQTQDVFLYCLRILTNLVFNSPCCLNIVARDENYRKFMQVLLDTMSSKKLDPELLVQITHLSYLIESSVDVKTTTLAKHAKSALQDIVKKIGVKSGNEYLHYISSSIYYMGQCVNTILTQIGKEHEDEFTKLDGAGDNSQKDNRKSPPLQVNNFVKEIAVRLVPDFLKELPLLQTENPQLMVESLLGLVTSTFPHCIPVSAYDRDVLESLIRCIDILASITKPKSNSHLVVIQTYNHFVERLLTASTRNIDFEVFHNAFKSCQIVPASTSKDMVRNVASIRLLMYFTNMVAFNDLIKKHLKEDVLLKLVECLLVEKPEPFMPPNRLVSMCLVEALNAISTTSKCPTVLMDNIQQEETLIHIANCIVNGDVALMGKGLSLTGAVGFTPKCRNDLSKIMAAMRESSPKYGSTAISQDVLVTVSDKARFGVKKLNTNLEMFMQTYDGNDYAVDDVLSWHKMKSDMHEVEIASMRDQVFQLNRTIAQFKVLINKQSELITSRAESTSTLQKDFKHMKQMVESMKEKKIELETKHEKTTDALRKQLNYQEDLFKSKSERMVQLEKQIIDFKEENKKLEAAKLEATQSTRQLTADNAKLQKKLDELESNRIELEFETIVEEVQRLKRDGNDYYWNDKNYSFAIKKWKKAVTMIEAYPVGNEEDDQIRRELIWRLYASVAQGYLRLERPVEACSACNLGLKWADIHGESSLELYFRFAKAKLMLNDHKAALGLIKGALNIEPLNEQCLQLKLEIQHKGRADGVLKNVRRRLFTDNTRSTKKSGNGDFMRDKGFTDPKNQVQESSEKMQKLTLEKATEPQTQLEKLNSQLLKGPNTRCKQYNLLTLEPMLFKNFIVPESKTYANTANNSAEDSEESSCDY